MSLPQEQEGVIKYTLTFDQTDSPTIPNPDFLEIESWRRICWQTELIGQDRNRYGGYGFGNISLRTADDEAGLFYISCSQTGSKPHLDPGDYATVRACNPTLNRVTASGPARPSSESMTHGVIYLLDAGVGGVVHAHSPHIWSHAEALNLPMTRAEVPYGTPEMAAEVTRLWQAYDLQNGQIFGMAGHEDGVVSFGATLEEAMQVMLSVYARALRR